LSIDDFGTGYSSLGSLHTLPFDVLKIDRSFVDVIGKSEGSSAIVRAIITMAHNLDIKVVAEGVETEEQLKFLRVEGCDEIQGYLISRPLDSKGLEDFFEKAPQPLRAVK